MQHMSFADYKSLRKNAEVIEEDGCGDKVLRLGDGSFLKLFRRKRLITSAAIWPYAQRFADNAKKLCKLGIPCPTVINVYRVPEIERDIVHYHPLPGLTLRQLREGEGVKPDDLRDRFASFVHHIHDLGVYFRSIHLGNVVLTPEGDIGLIDIADLKIYGRPLSKWQRKRNFAHMVRDDKDEAWLGETLDQFKNP